MKKILATATLVLFVAAMVFAQGAPKKILSASDVDAFVANYEALEADLDALEGKYDYLFDPIDEQMEDETADIAGVFGQMRGIDVPAEIRDVFKKHGMGSDGFEKMIVITASYQTLEMDAQMVQFEQQFKDNPDMQPYLDMAKTQNEELKKVLHKGDIAVVKTRLEDLRGMFME